MHPSTEPHDLGVTQQLATVTGHFTDGHVATLTGGLSV